MSGIPMPYDKRVTLERPELKAQKLASQNTRLFAAANAFHEAYKATLETEARVEDAQTELRSAEDAKYTSRRDYELARAELMRAANALGFNE